MGNYAFMRQPRFEPGALRRLGRTYVPVVVLAEL